MAILTTGEAAAIRDLLKRVERLEKLADCSATPDPTPDDPVTELAWELHIRDSSEQFAWNHVSDKAKEGYRSMARLCLIREKRAVLNAVKDHGCICVRTNEGCLTCQYKVNLENELNALEKEAEE